MMGNKLWLLVPLPDRADPGKWPTWGESRGFVIRASSEIEARGFAAIYTDAEGSNSEGDNWMDSERSTCRRIDQPGDPGVILESNVGG